MRQYYFNCRSSDLFMNADRNSTSVIFNRYAVIFFNGNDDMITKTSESFIDAVVNNFPNEMMKPAGTRRTDIHAWTLANRFQAFQHLNLTFIIILRLFQFLF